MISDHFNGTRYKKLSTVVVAPTDLKLVRIAEWVMDCYCLHVVAVCV